MYKCCVNKLCNFQWLKVDKYASKHSFKLSLINHRNTAYYYNNKQENKVDYKNEKGIKDAKCNFRTYNKKNLFWQLIHIHKIQSNTYICWSGAV